LPHGGARGTARALLFLRDAQARACNRRRNPPSLR